MAKAPSGRSRFAIISTAASSVDGAGGRFPNMPSLGLVFNWLDSRLVVMVATANARQRLRIYYSFTDGGAAVCVHANSF